MSHQDYQNSKMIQFMNRNIWVLSFVLLSLNVMLVIKILPYQNSLKEKDTHVKHSITVHTWLGSTKMMYFIPVLASTIMPHLILRNTVVSVFW